MERDLSEIIDISFLQRFQDSFSNATGMASITNDLNGPVTAPSNFTEFCIDLTRGSNEGLRRCVECDLSGGKEAADTGRPAVYFCHAGLVDFSAPIVINGVQIGSIQGGQVLTEPPDEDKFRRIAIEIGIDPDIYIKALRKIKVVPERQVREAAALLNIVIEEVVRNHTQYLKLTDVYSSINEDVNVINDKISNFMNNAESLNVEQKLMLNHLNSLSITIKNINNIVATVANIAKKTQIISINASIESAKSGLEGKSFAVIAKEIRDLAISTNEMVSQIEKYTNEISQSIKESLRIGTENTDLLEEHSNEIIGIIPILGNILEQLQELSFD